MGQLMDDQKVRAAVEAAVRKAMNPASYSDHNKPVDEIMTIISEHAADEYSRGRSDGRFTESFYGMSGDF